MRVPSIDVIAERMFGLPDKVAMRLPELQKVAGEFADLLAKVPVGLLDTLTRDGNNFIARATAPLSITHKFVVIHSDAVVKFTAHQVRKELRVTNISGLTVELPIPLVPRIKLDWANVWIDERGLLVLYTRKGFIPVTVRVDPVTGNYSIF